ncbi:MAG: transcription elongation factor GreA [Chloroflexi bacterium]|nr:MAG: transcription elongation factor GreA [Chloroflexota bacterium]
MATRDVPVTKEGLAKIQKELVELINERRPELAQRIHDSKELVGPQNTPEYEDVRTEQAYIEGRIVELENMIENAVIIKETHDHQNVSLGSKVKVKNHEGKTVSYTIVGAAETDPKAGKISNESPVGEALLGRHVGEEFEFEAPAGTLIWKIVAVD